MDVFLISKLEILASCNNILIEFEFLKLNEEEFDVLYFFFNSFNSYSNFNLYNNNSLFNNIFSCFTEPIGKI